MDFLFYCQDQLPVFSIHTQCSFSMNHFAILDLTRTSSTGLIGGGCLNDLYTTYVLHSLESKELDDDITLSPPALTFLQPGSP